MHPETHQDCFAEGADRHFLAQSLVRTASAGHPHPVPTSPGEKATFVPPQWSSARSLFRGSPDWPVTGRILQESQDVGTCTQLPRNSGYQAPLLRQHQATEPLTWRKAPGGGIPLSPP